MLKKFLTLSLLLFSTISSAEYVYEANQPLIDLKTNYIATSYNLASGDDQVSSTFNLDFTYTFYGQDFTMVKMATNGCLHFWKSGSSGYCNDYTPDPLPYRNYTLYPFWTDLIRDNGSKVLARNFTDKSVFGWYNLREYNRSNTDNSFEVILWKADDSFEFRYGGLNIIQHDVIIGEQGDSDEVYTYLHYDECSTGTTNGSSCVSQNWNSSTFNTLLENGGSLYGVGSGNALDCSNPLNSTSCTGYAAAYLTQQCGIDSLHSESCPLYWEAYDDLQCDLDPQYSPSCAGYTQEQSVAYYTEEEHFDYGYDDYADQYGFDEYGFDDDPYAYQEFTDEEWYEIDLEEFGQEQVDEWYGTDVAFNEDGFIDFDSHMEEELFFTGVEDGMTQYDLEQEILYITENYETYEEYVDPYIEEFYQINDYQDDYYSIETLQFNPDELLDEFVHLEILEEIEDYEDINTYVSIDTLQELEEWFEEEIAQHDEEHEEFEEEFEEEWEEEFEEEFEETEELYAEEEFEETLEEELYAEEEIFEEEAVEEIYEELEEIQEELVAEAEEELREDSEELIAEGGEPSERRGGITQDQLNVVAGSITAASNSMSGTTAGTTAASGGWGSSQSSGVSSTYGGASAGSVGSTSVAGNTTSSAIASSSTGGGISTSSSPSISDQIQTAAVQTNTILSLNQDMGSTSGMGGSSQTVSNVTTTITPMPGVGDAGSSQVVMAEVQVQNMQGEIDTAVSGVMTASEADSIADQIVAQNLKNAQEDMTQAQEDTGQYADQTAYVAYLGYNPGFTTYYGQEVPKKQDWYEPREIYANVSISDNTSGFYSLAGQNLRTLNTIINQQPNLDGGTL